MTEAKLIIDGHVHYYDCYDPEKFFDMAIKNIGKMYRPYIQEIIDNNYQIMLLFILIG